LFGFYAVINPPYKGKTERVSIKPAIQVMTHYSLHMKYLLNIQSPAEKPDDF